MATVQSIDNDATKERLALALQSAHINFLLGSGASAPAIPLAGDIERNVDHLLANNEQDAATACLCDLLASIQHSTNGLLAPTVDPKCASVLGQYQNLLTITERLLASRRTNLLPRQATFFTTNYDLFLEVASRACLQAAINSGFSSSPLYGDPADYSSRRFFRTTYDTGGLFDYRVELPALNFVKLHGCLSWKATHDRIEHRAGHFAVPALTDAASRTQFADRYAVVLPRKNKFEQTVLERTYYELLRLLANALDKENSLLLAFGFSFQDEHILHIVRRALVNPTLRVLIMAYDKAAVASFSTLFAGHVNVVIVEPTDPHVLDFETFNAFLARAVPTS